MSKPRRETQQPIGYVPQLTALSTAFPLNNEELGPVRRSDGKQGEKPGDGRTAQPGAARPPHRHDAGE